MTVAWGVQPHLDRMGEVRHCPEEIARLWARPDTALLVVDAAKGVATRDGHILPSPAHGDHDPSRHVLLGSSGGRVWFACRGEVPEGHSLRDATFDAAEVELLTAATAVLAWHDSAPYCERCGAPSLMAAGGFQRECTGCGREIFPRTDPAMIVAVLDEQDRLLLAHQASWPEGRVSVLAGFLEAGESAEHAVVREVREESGLAVNSVRFLATQPWPYPRSLMLSFVARASGGIAVDGREIEWARWYSPSDYEAALAEGLVGPGLGSVAGRMIDAWRRGELRG